MTRGGPPTYELDKGLIIPHHKNSLLQNVAQGHSHDQILCNSLYNGKWIWDLENEMIGVPTGQVHWEQQQAN